MTNCHSAELVIMRHAPVCYSAAPYDLLAEAQLLLQQPCMEF